MTDLTAWVEDAVRRILARREGLGDPGMEPRRTVEHQMREAHRLLSEYQAAIGGGHSAVLKASASVERWRSERAQVVGIIGEWHRLSETARTQAERDAYKLGADWLRGDVSTYELPGAVVMKRKELPNSRVLPLPTIDGELAKLEADLARHVEKLRSELDGFDRWAVNATVSADVPAIQSEMSATVR